ncbi:MAG: hypothetical protein HY905_24070 [Deltaproteobacteria bacterium]|nr:hypothetical protein [Deltaproteobacteria bacterium]
MAMTMMKKLLIGAAVTGALAALPIACKGSKNAEASPEPTADKQGCRGMPGQGDAGTDRDTCAGHGEQGAPPEKAACAGKEGCGGKAGTT